MTKDKKTVMLVDNDVSIVEIVSAMLEFSNYRVRVVTAGNVVPQIKVEKPDVVLMDVSMPQADGRDVCRAVKMSGETSDVPVILISAGYNVGHSSKAAGADDFIAKPFDMCDLLRRVDAQANKNPHVRRT